LVGWLSGVRTQSGAVAMRDVKRFRHFREAAMPKGECGLSSYTLAFALSLRKNHGKTSVSVAQRCQLGPIPFVNRAALAATMDCNYQHPQLALWVGQVNHWSAQISAELPN
jgi:hypothetical protein